jgi:hypothetical protein
VSEVLVAVRSKDDPGYDKVAKGAVFMAAPDFALPMSRADFEQVLGLCSEPRIVRSRVTPKMQDYQLVRVEMQCRGKDHPKPVAVVWDIMADDDRIFAVLPGGIEHVWPNLNSAPMLQRPH